MTDKRTIGRVIPLTMMLILGCVAGCSGPLPPGPVTVKSGTIGGGVENKAGEFATVCGGSHNVARAYHAAIGGGSYNTASVGHSVVGGGLQNTASGSMTTVGGGWSNAATHVCVFR
jgi:hypothetical protein